MHLSQPVESWIVVVATTTAVCELARLAVAAEIAVAVDVAALPVVVAQRKDSRCDWCYSLSEGRIVQM